jgi:hypothetical protein
MDKVLDIVIDSLGQWKKRVICAYRRAVRKNSEKPIWAENSVFVEAALAAGI